MAAKPASNVVTTTELVQLLGLPGWWTLARLEERGILVHAKRGLWTNWRWWYRDEVPAIRSRLSQLDAL